MKKFIGILLALMIVISGLAFAETRPVEPEGRYILVSMKSGDGERFALIGAGDGKEAFDAFASDDAEYEDRYDDFWTTVLKLEPTMILDGEAEELSFAPDADGKNTVVSMNGEAVAELNGLTAFAIFTGELKNGQPEVDEDLSVFFWTHAEVTRHGDDAESGAKICPRCGKLDDGSAEHRTAISQFCEEGHTKCMGNPIHHCEACGRDYPCSKSNSHARCIKCGKNWCDKTHGDHKELECGHRGCEVFEHEDEHAKCPGCDGYLCDGGDHTLAACGVHHADAEGEHETCEHCGEFLCNGKSHEQLPCGHYACEVVGQEQNHAKCPFEGCDRYQCDAHEHLGEPPVAEGTEE